MLRKIFFGLLLLVLLTVGGGWLYLHTHSDAILHKFSELVEENTGKALHMEKLPQIHLFPKLSLTLGASSWGEEDSDLSVKFSRASINISASALISGHMELTAFEADDLQLRCRLPEEEQSSAPASASPVAVALDRRNMAILEARFNEFLAFAPDSAVLNRASVLLSWPDGRNYVFSDIHIALSEVRPNASIGLAASGHMALTEQAHQPAHAASFELQSNLVFKDGMFAAVVHKALLHPLENITFSQDMALSGGLSWTPSTHKLELSTLKMQLPGFDLAASGSLAVPDLVKLAVYEPQKLSRHILHEGQGGLELRCSGSPRDLMQAFGQHPFLDSEALSSLSAEAVLRLEPGRMVLDKLEGEADGTSFSGHLESSLEPPALRGTLALGDVNPERYRLIASSSSGPVTLMPHMTEHKTESGATVLVMLPWPSLDLSLTMQSFTLEQWKLEKVQMRVSGTEGSYSANPFTFSLWDSQAKASVDVVLPEISEMATGGSLDKTRVKVKVSAENMDLYQAARTLLHSKSFSAERIMGRGRINADLGCVLSDIPATLTGKGSFSAAPLQVKLTGITELARQLKGLTALLGGRTQGIERIESLVTSGTDFDKMLISFTADKGKINLSSARGVSPELELDSSGTINLLSEQLDLAGTVSITGLGALPLSMGGTFHDPKFRLGNEKSKQRLELLLPSGGKLEQKLNRELGRLFQKF